jgi:hypothetical protein
MERRRRDANGKKAAKSPAKDAKFSAKKRRASF